jgi:hypothetical protein
MHLRIDPLEFLDHEPPAGRRLQRDLQTRLAKRLEERADPSAVPRHDPGARHLAGDRVDPFRGDLRSMLIQAHHDRHVATPSTPPTPASTTTPTALRAAHRIP